LLASPSWVAKRIARGKAPANTMNEATFRRRLLIYYAVFGVFVAGWTVYTLVLRKHAIDLNQTIDGKLSR
jgi:hypothetical protein